MSVSEEANKINIRIRLEKWSEIPEEKNFRMSKELCGFPWELRASKDEDGDLTMTLYIFMDNESNVWFCDTSIEFSIINQKEGADKHTLHIENNHRFTWENCDEGVDARLEKRSLIANEELGFIKNDVIIVEAYVTIHSIEGKRFRKKIEYDLLSPSPKSDGILVIEGTKVYVSKQLMSIQSPFFDRIFYGKFKEAEEMEIEIKDVVLEEFGVLLRMLYRTGELFSDENIGYILKLADRFEMLSVLDDAEKYLLSSNDSSIHKKIGLSDQYNLVVLQDQLIPKYTAELIRELKKSADYGLLKEETKDILFQKYIDLTSK